MALIKSDCRGVDQFEIKKHFKTVFGLVTKTQRGWDLFLDGEFYGWYATRKQAEEVIRTNTREVV